jgi:hypothetical protein
VDGRVLTSPTPEQAGLRQNYLHFLRKCGTDLADGCVHASRADKVEASVLDF